MTRPTKGPLLPEPEDPEAADDAKMAGGEPDRDEIWLTELIDELREPEFEQFAVLIHDIDEPPALDPRLAAFIDDYAKFCAELYSRGFVPDSTGEASLLRQYLRAYDGRRSQRGGVVRAPRTKSKR